MSKPNRPQPPAPPVIKAAERSPFRQAGAKPAAPPAYRPQPTPKVLQRKAAPQQPVNQTKLATAAPPVYRPQATPKVFQRKAATIGQLQKPQVEPKPLAPTAPRPQPGPQCPPKVAGSGNQITLKRLSRPPAPPSPPASAAERRGGVLQRKQPPSGTSAPHQTGGRMRPGASITNNHLSLRQGELGRPTTKGQGHAAPPVRQIQPPAAGVVQPTLGWGLVGAAVGAVGGALLGGGLTVAGLAYSVMGMTGVGLLGNYGSDSYYAGRFQDSVRDVLDGTRLIIGRNKKTSTELGAILTDINLLPSLTEISLTTCSFPPSWSTARFAALRHLQAFTIFNPVGDPATPVDALSGLVGVASLNTLELVRCPFVKDCFDNLGRMTQLQTLNLMRSMAIEKFPGQYRKPAVAALKRLISAGTLRSLNLDANPGLAREDVEELIEAANQTGCHVSANIKFRM